MIPDGVTLPTPDPIHSALIEQDGLVVDERTQTAPPGFVEPTFGQRLLARLVDSAVLLPMASLIGVLAEGQVRTATGLAVAAVYEILLVSLRGQTVGKIAMETRIVDRESGSLPGTAQIALRWLVLVAGSLFALVIPVFDNVDIVYTLVVLLPILRPPLHRGLHDTASGTVVTSLRTAPELRELASAVLGGRTLLIADRERRVDRVMSDDCRSTSSPAGRSPPARQRMKVNSAT